MTGSDESSISETDREHAESFKRGASYIAFCILLGSWIAKGRIKRDLTDKDLADLNNVLIGDGFLPIPKYQFRSFLSVARVIKSVWMEEAK
jgi:hypothetical protein